jgi:uracil-DNA glycosylase
LSRPVIVGQAPGRTPGEILGGRAGRRLASLAGIDELGDGFDLVNLLDEYPGASPNGKGDLFDDRLGRAAAFTLAPRLRDRRVVLLGRRVATAFGVGREPAFVWMPAGAIVEQRVIASWECGIMPHPSGIVRWWNDPENWRRASEFLRGALE